MNIEIKVDTSKLDRMLADFPGAIERAKRNALEAIGEEVVSESKLAFRRKNYRPSPWEPRKKTYVTVISKKTGKAVIDKKTGKKKRKLDKHPLLIKSGVMRQSIDWKLMGNDAVVVGSGAKYAPFHQFGTKHMPARPFFPVDADGNLTPRAQRKIVKYVKDALSEELRRIGLK